MSFRTLMVTKPFGLRECKSGIAIRVALADHSFAVFTASSARGTRIVELPQPVFSLYLLSQSLPWLFTWHWTLPSSPTR
jgi:hypothetical protein